MAEKQDSGIIQATAFTPIDQAGRGGARRIRVGVVVGGALAVVAFVIMIYLFSARAVIFRLTPETANIDIGGLDFNLGNNYLLLPGERAVIVSAEGYVTKEISLDISDASTQEIAVALEPLPGNLRVQSSLDDIDVIVDGKVLGTAPGVIENIQQGNRNVEFTKHRYFPLKKSIEIEGLGKTQAVEITLDPAWGWLEISAEPAGAEILVDGKKVAESPAKIEILETGSDVSVAAEGYKAWQQKLTVTAGTTETYPVIKLDVADGTLAISSTPLGAAVTIDGSYIGVTPLSAPVSPLKEHRVEFFLEGYLKATKTAKVTSEKTTALDAGLKPNIGTIKLNILPADAVVTVDGRTVSSGSINLSLPAKKHNLVVDKAGYQSYKAVITPNPSQPQSLNISLLTTKQAYWAERPAATEAPAGGQLKLFKPSGTFTLGAPRREAGRRANESERTVRLERPFYIGLKEITNGQFRQWRETHSSTSLRGNSLDMDEQPVVMVSWDDAALFCNWLSEKQGLPKFYRVSGDKVTGFDWQASGYRLPTEAEWAWVAKIDANGKSMVFPWGNDMYPPTTVIENYADPSAANLVTFVLKDYPDRYPVSAVVGSFSPNHKGLYDIGGNVAEWVNDFYDTQAHSGKAIIDPRGPDSGARHTVRGASWALASRADLRLSARRAGADGELDIGFRIARYVDNVGAVE